MLCLGLVRLGLDRAVGLGILSSAAPCGSTVGSREWPAHMRPASIERYVRSGDLTEAAGRDSSVRHLSSCAKVELVSSARCSAPACCGTKRRGSPSFSGSWRAATATLHGDSSPWQRECSTIHAVIALPAKASRYGEHGRCVGDTRHSGDAARRACVAAVLSRKAAVA